jgi:hypothetical protein
MTWLLDLGLLSVAFSLGFVAGTWWHALHLQIAKDTGERP